MATESVSTLLEYLHRMAQGQECADVPDGALLDKFVTQRDESAFSALVQRHGQMVWGVCRRLLHSHHDSEDAFQATFLILALKATSIVPRGMVGNWLHGVAYQTALKARAISARRGRTEVQVPELPEPIVEEHASWSDIRSLIDDELCRLPDRHRAVVVLCDLEGNTRSEAARHLGVPEGTIAGWLSRGRAKLAHRLSQRGVVLSGGGLALVLSQSAASGQMPVALASSTTKAAIAFAAQSAMATGTISPLAIALTKGGLKSMFFNRFKLPLACLVICVVSVVGMHLTHFAAAGQDDKKQATPEQPVNKPKIDDATADLTLKLKGKWINVDEGSVGDKRIIIEHKDDNDETNQGWTVLCTKMVTGPTGKQKEVEVEKLKLHMLRESDVRGKVIKDKGRVEYGFAIWESKERGQKLCDYHMTLRMKDELLVVETYAIPTGQFVPQHWRCEYKKEK
jgi:RNA polymerase sigma factor (sigma-70 family)